MAMTDTVTKAQLDGWFESISNWGRWGDDDQRGALNLITDAKRAEAASLVRTGAIVSCAQELPKRPAPDNPTPVIHAMQGAGDVTRGGAGGASDMIAINPHGYATTHLDALCHIFHNDRMYNGYPASMVTSIGARLNSIMAGQDGIVSRGVLLDIPALRGVDYLEPGERILVADLEAAEERQGVRVTPGDILLVRTGRDERNAAEGRWDPMSGGLAGLSGETAPWLRDRDVAVLGGDGVSDALPSLVPEWAMPIHALALVALGVHLIDNMQLSRLAAACEEFGRWEFQLTLAPLRLAQGTGSPVNPIALFELAPPGRLDAIRCRIESIDRARGAEGRMIYELRIYEAAPGKMPALHARFRDHTMRIFGNHGMEVVGFWTYAHGGWSDQLVYIMRFDSMEDRAAKWAAFGADEEWRQVVTESQRDGSLTTRIRSDILAATDYSPMQ